MVNFMKFSDNKGYLLAVRKDYCSEKEAMEIAKKELITDSVTKTNEYKYMYHGFGKTIDMDEWENTWWLTADRKGNSMDVYVFREDLN